MPSLCQTSLIIYPSNDCVLEAQIIDVINGSNLSSAAVTYDLKNASGTTIDSGAMVYVDIVASVYYRFRATLADSINVVAGNKYTIIIDCDAGAGKRGNWSPDVIAEKRV